MKIAILGGHLSPALSIIEKIPRDWEILFIGRKKVFEGDHSESLEYKTITEKGIKFENIRTGRLQRKFSRNTLLSIAKVPVGFSKALRIMIKHKPDVVVGFGSYIQLPVVVAASVLRIPVVIHEQTFEAGFSNRICAKFAKKICISWESSGKYFPKEKTVLTGIPLREDVIEASSLEKSSSEKIIQIFITGGSSGSHFINDLLGKILKNLLKEYKIIHQTGDSKTFNDFEKLDKFRNDLPESLKNNYKIKKFIEPKEFTSILSSSDLIISRGGINTVYEIFVLGKPAIVIPIPFSQKNEQLQNAIFLENEGLAEIIEQKNATPELLEEKIEKIKENMTFYQRKSQYLNLNAADKIIDEIKRCVEGK